MSVHDLMVLRGRAASDAVVFAKDGPEGRSFARFRMAVPRARRRDDGQWEDAEPQWYTVKAWGSLADHLHLSLRRGAPIVVVGRPSAQAWIDRGGELRSALDIHAVTIGHDLVYGVSSFARLRRPVEAEGDQAAAGDSSSKEDLGENDQGPEAEPDAPSGDTAPAPALASDSSVPDGGFDDVASAGREVEGGDTNADDETRSRDVV